MSTPKRSTVYVGDEILPSYIWIYDNYNKPEFKDPDESTTRG